MQSIAVLCMIVATAAMLFVGGRLLLVAKQTRELPELLFGITFVATAVGQAFAQVGMRTIWNEPGTLATAMNIACFGLVLLGNYALWIVTWRLYRPGRGWGFVACWVGIAAATLAYAIRIYDGDFSDASIATRGYLMFILLRCLLMSWVTLEAFHYHSLLRRRLALGLADPVATNQILLWSISGLTSLMASLIIFYTVFGMGVHPLDLIVPTVMLMTVAGVTSVFMWCAFFPPQWLRRRIIASAERYRAGSKLGQG